MGADLDDSDTVYEAARRGGSPGVLNYAIHHAGLYRPGSSELMYFYYMVHGDCLHQEIYDSMNVNSNE